MADQDSSQGDAIFKFEDGSGRTHVYRVQASSDAARRVVVVLANDGRNHVSEWVRGIACALIGAVAGWGLCYFLGG